MSTATGSTAAVASALAQQPPPGAGKTVFDDIESRTDEFARALPATISPERFTRIVLTELRKTPDLVACSRTSFLGAVMAAAQLGLEFGPLGHAYLVPYKRDCTLIIGYKGYIDLARRSGQIKDIVARPIYEGDEYDSWSDELGDHMLHRQCKDTSKRGSVVGYYGRMIFVNGGVHIEEMTPEDVEERRKRSATANSSRSPWKSDYMAMALKTVVRKMVPWMPLTTEVAAQLAQDDAIIRYDPATKTIIGTEFPVIDTTAEEVDGGVAKSEWRQKAEADLEEYMHQAADFRSAQTWLLENFGPIPTLDDEQLGMALAKIQLWLNEPQEPEEAFVVDPTDPGPTEAPEAAEPDSEPSEPLEVDDETAKRIYGSTVATVTAMQLVKVNELLGLFATEADGPIPRELGKKKQLLIEILNRERLAGNEAAELIF